jgi:hypothetical protein
VSEEHLMGPSMSVCRVFRNMGPGGPLLEPTVAYCYDLRSQMEDTAARQCPGVVLVQELPKTQQCPGIELVQE